MYDPTGNRLVEQVYIDSEGDYDIDLPVGEYRIDIEKFGVDFSDEVPRNIQITVGKTGTME